MTELAPESAAEDNSADRPARAGGAGGPARAWWYRWAVPLALGAGYVAQVLFRLWMARSQDYPVVSPDEADYLVMARMLAGLPTTQIPGDEVIPGGYSLLISPALRITQDPVFAYQLIMVINALISCLVLPLAYWGLRRLQVPKLLSYLFATAIVMLPPVVFYSQYAMADTALPALVLAWLIGIHGLLSDGTTKRRIWFGVLAGAAGGYTILVHDRGGVVIALTGLVLLIVLVLGWAPRLATSAALAALAVMFVAKRLMNSWLVSVIDHAHPSAVGNIVIETLKKPEMFRRTVMRTVGHLWYFTTSTWGIGAVVIVVCVVAVFHRRTSRADRAVAFLMVSLMSGIALAAAAGLPEDHRIDTITYARYLSPLVAVFFVVGAAALHRVGSRRKLLVLGVASVAVVGGLTMVLLDMAGKEFKQSWFIPWGLPDSTFLATRWSGNWQSFHAGRTTLVAVIILVVVLAVRLLAGAGRRARLATGAIAVGMAALAAFASVSITDNVTRPNTKWRYADTLGFLKAGGVSPADRLVMDPGLRWETRMMMSFEMLQGRVWTRSVVGGESVPDGATAVAVGLWKTDVPAEASWPNAPKGWHVASYQPKKGFVIWRKG